MSFACLTSHACLVSLPHLSLLSYYLTSTYLFFFFFCFIGINAGQVVALCAVLSHLVHLLIIGYSPCDGIWFLFFGQSAWRVSTGGLTTIISLRISQSQIYGRGTPTPHMYSSMFQFYKRVEPYDMPASQTSSLLIFSSIGLLPQVNYATMF